ncbi:hypothetical protein SH501x_000983 [Pirellulaceae bacterium SH501]
MIFGDPTQLGIEAEITSQHGTFVFGRLQIWASDVPIGRYSEEVIDLKSTTGRFREPIAALTSDLCSHTSADFLNHVWNVVYGSNSGLDIEQFGRLRPFVWIDSCEGFENIRSVASRDNGVCRIVWQNMEGDNVVREISLPSYQYNAIVEEFLSWLDGELLRRRGKDQKMVTNNAVNPSGGSGEG